MPAQEIIPSNIATEPTLQSVTDLLNEVAIRLCDIADSMGNLSPDVGGRLRVVSDVTTSINTVNSMSSLANQVAIGTYAANQHIIALTQMAEGELRRNIVIS